MNFTFGIITNNGQYLFDAIKSIINLNIPNYEIVIVGNVDFKINLSENIKFIEFFDNCNNFSISTKKNIITENSNFENIVYLHDYIFFDKNWYDGFLKFDSDFEVCMTKIFNKDGTRYRDWCLWQDDANNFVSINNYLIPYDIQNLSEMMYISGSYWIAKRDFMLKNPLDDRLKWGQGEDVEWSLRVRDKTIFKINKESSVHLLKQKDRVFNETTDLENLVLKKIKNYNNKNSYDMLIKNHIGRWL
jgi:hypothetical protein